MESLAAAGLRVSVVTNLSSSDADLARFADATRRKPGVISASLAPRVRRRHRVSRQARPPRRPPRRQRRRHLRRHPGPPPAPARPLCPLRRGRRHPQDPAREARPRRHRPTPPPSATPSSPSVATAAPATSTPTSPAAPAGRRPLLHRRPHRRSLPLLPRSPLPAGTPGQPAHPGFRLRTDAQPCHYSYCNCTVPQQRGMVDTR
ncbi:MAG: hypothetical protein R3F43_09295 [bacterium]